MSKFKAMRHAIRLYGNAYVDKSTQRHNQRQWLNAIQYLGDKWILANPVNRKGGV